MKIRTTITLALLVAAIAAPAARPDIPPNVSEHAANQHQVSALDPAIANAIARERFNTLDPAITNAIARERFNTLDPAIANAIVRRTTPSPTAVVQGAATPVERVVRGSGFSWREFSLGASAMLGLVVLLGGVAMAARALRSNRSH